MKSKALVLFALLAFACRHAPTPLPAVTATLQTLIGVAAVTDITVTALLAEEPVQEMALMANMTGAMTADAISKEFGRFTRESPPGPTAETAEAPREAAQPVAEPPVAEHKAVETAKQAITTFAIDVDRASYATVRDLVSRGIKPPAQTVRIEELLNYFSYDYPRPANGAPFSVTTEVAGCPWNPATRLLRVGIQARDLHRSEMTPNNLVFLIDVSASMGWSPNRLELVKRGLSVLTEELRAEDRVSVVVYAGGSGLKLPSTSGADKETILAAIHSLTPGGTTAGSDGIQHAYRVARENFLEDGNNRVILATDGDFNVGVSSIPALTELIEEERRSGVFLSVIGVGNTGNLREDVMETLADKGNGIYVFLDSDAEAEKVFVRELTGTLVTIAQDVKVQLDFDPKAVLSYRQIGYENRALANEDFEDDMKDAGELGAGHSVTALFELVPAPGSRGRIGTLRVRYKEPRGAASRPLVAEIVDEGKGAYDASPDMQFAAAVAELGMLLRDSPHKGTATWDDMLTLARISTGADLEGERRELVALAERARAMK